jgi:hypothetical protein
VRMHVLLTDDDARAARLYESLGFCSVRTLATNPLTAYVRAPGSQLG